MTPVRKLRRESFLPALAALAGPALILLSVLVVLHDFVFGGLASFQTGDPLRFWLPNHCFLGRSLAGGDIPEWNPYSMGGVPFAADPQSGWMNLPAMFLYTVLPCDRALAIGIALSPALAGLGVYWFARSEGLSRVAATVGGLTLSLLIAGSSTAVKIPFAAGLAWTAVELACASRAFHARTWSGRLLWIVATAVAWGQIAASMLSHGLAIGTGALVVYAVAATIRARRNGGLSWRDLALIGIVLVLALPAVNLAYLAPRVAYLPRTTLGPGYEGLSELAAELNAQGPESEFEHAYALSWPLKLGWSPGAFAGGGALVAVFAAFWIPRLRYVAIAVAVFGAVCYLASTRVVADVLAPRVASAPFGDFYAHAPHRFSFGVFLALAVLAALGVQAWIDAPSVRVRILMAAPAIAVWGVLPLALGVEPSALALTAAGGTVALAIILMGLRRAVLLVLLPVSLSAELVFNALAGQSGRPQEAYSGLSISAQRWSQEPLLSLKEPNVDVARFVRGGSILERVARNDQGRLMTAGKPVRSVAGPTMSEVEGLEGYNSVQLLTYWTFVRSAQPHPLRYNVSTFQSPAEPVTDLLQVGWVSSDDPLPGRGLVSSLARGDRFLYEVASPAPRASLVGSWSIVDEASALATVTDSSWRPAQEVILLEDPGIPAGDGGSSGAEVGYVADGPGAARISVDAPAPALVLVRNVFDENWNALVDGHEAPVLRADYLIQAVAVDAGRHTIELSYDDPWIERGLAGSLIALFLLAGPALPLRSRRAGADR